VTTTAYLSLGSNLGNRQQYLVEAIERLEAEHTHVVGVSSIYETLPQGKTDQPLFLNMAAAVETELDAHGLLHHMQAVEKALGRERREKWGPRTIDIDLLLYGSAVIQDPELTVPHPYMCQRAFVMVPLLELNPHLTLPDGQPLEPVLRLLPDQGVVWAGDFGAGPSCGRLPGRYLHAPRGGCW